MKWCLHYQLIHGIWLRDHLSHQQHLLLGPMCIVHDAHKHKMYDVENVHMINSCQSYIIAVRDCLSHQYHLHLGSMHKIDDLNMHKMYDMANIHVTFSTTLCMWSVQWWFWFILKPPFFGQMYYDKDLRKLEALTRECLQSACNGCGKDSHASINQEGCKGEIRSPTMRTNYCFRDKQIN